MNDLREMVESIRARGLDVTRAGLVCLDPTIEKELRVVHLQRHAETGGYVPASEARELLARRAELCALLDAEEAARTPAIIPTRSSGEEPVSSASPSRTRGRVGSVSAPEPALPGAEDAAHAQAVTRRREETPEHVPKADPSPSERSPGLVVKPEQAHTSGQSTSVLQRGRKCDRCGHAYKPALRGTGGRKRSRFCSTSCRSAWHRARNAPTMPVDCVQTQSDAVNGATPAQGPTPPGPTAHVGKEAPAAAVPETREERGDSDDTLELVECVAVEPEHPARLVVPAQCFGIDHADDLARNRATASLPLRSQPPIMRILCALDQMEA